MLTASAAVRTREAAAEAARKPDSELVLDPDAEGAGLREWSGPLCRAVVSLFAKTMRAKRGQLDDGDAELGVGPHGRSIYWTQPAPQGSAGSRVRLVVSAEMTRARIVWGNQTTRSHRGPLAQTALPMPTPSQDRFD
jgi:hypothetical protein